MIDLRRKRIDVSAKEKNVVPYGSQRSKVTSFMTKIGLTNSVGSSTKTFLDAICLLSFIIKSELLNATVPMHHDGIGAAAERYMQYYRFK